MEIRKRVFVAYDDVSALLRTLGAIVNVAEQLPAEVVLLRVNLPINQATGAIDHQHLYSELKALQALLRVWPGRFRIEIMPGPVAAGILRYLVENPLAAIVNQHSEYHSTCSEAPLHAAPVTAG